MDFAEKYGPWAVVAGASEGIGRSLALELGARGLSVVLIAKDGPLEEVSEQLRREHGVDTRIARVDLAAANALEGIVQAAAGCEVGLYVANAGGDASASLFLDNDLAYWERLARMNMLTTLQACHHFGAGMRERKRGGLLLVNSAGCYGGGSYLATYNASKAFLLVFAEGLWAELHPHGIDVLTIALNSTDTPNFRRIVAKTGMPVPDGLASADEVASVALDRLPHGPVHNWGLADDEIGHAISSAVDRRKRILECDRLSRNIYSAPDVS